MIRLASALGLLAALLLPQQELHPWRWVYAASGDDEWLVVQGTASVRDSSGHLFAELRDDDDTSLVRITLDGLISGANVTATVTQLDTDADPFRATGKIAAFCPKGGKPGRQTIIVTAPGGQIIALFREIPPC